MVRSEHEQLSFHPEEESLGVVADNLFLDLRHRIMTADFGPGSFFHCPVLASARGMEESVVQSVASALKCHGYVTEMGGGKYQVKGWSAAEFIAALSKMRESQRNIAQKYSAQISDIDRCRLAACLDFSLSSSPTSDDVEAFYIRWWMFFHYTLHAYGMQSFRTLTLTITSPYLRRRLITGLTAELLNATFAGLRRLSAAFDEKQGNAAAALVDAYVDSITPILSETNDLYESCRSAAEIDYAMPPISGVPVFRAAGDPRPGIARGYREPLNWDQFVAMKLVQRQPHFAHRYL
jgi:DNA-binding GntR family transcriptional regulator